MSPLAMPPWNTPLCKMLNTPAITAAALISAAHQYTSPWPVPTRAYYKKYILHKPQGLTHYTGSSYMDFSKAFEKLKKQMPPAKLKRGYLLQKRKSPSMEKKEPLFPFLSQRKILPSHPNNGNPVTTLC